MESESKDYQMEIHHLNLHHHTVPHHLLHNPDLETTVGDTTKLLTFTPSSPLNSGNLNSHLQNETYLSENIPNSCVDSSSTNPDLAPSPSTSSRPSAQSTNKDSPSIKKASGHSIETSENSIHSSLVTQSTKCSCRLTVPTLATSSTTTPTPSSTTALISSDLAKDHWYPHPHSHHHNHTHGLGHAHHGHHQQLVEELAVYTNPATSSQIGKYTGFDATTGGYLNSRYNVNIKGVRSSDRATSSFFDIPAVTHPYCYRFPTTSPPAVVLKKNDEDSSFCNTSSVSSTLQISHNFHNGRVIEHPDSTTHLSHPHSHHHQAHHLQSHHHQPHHHHHHHPNTLQTQLTHMQHPNENISHCISSYKTNSSISSSLPPTLTSCADAAAAAAAVYHHYNSTSAVNPNTSYALRPATDITTTSLDHHSIRYESPYNSGISSSYSVRSSMVDSSNAVTSSDGDLKFDSAYNGSNQTSIGPSSISHRRGSLQLWQFLVALLDEPNTSSNCIAWTGRGMEFKLIEPEEVARRWGIQKNRPAMNYDKLSRSLRYYYEKGIMQKVNGERYVYRFVCDPDALFNMAYGHLSNNVHGERTKSDHNSYDSTTTTTGSTTKSNTNNGGDDRAN